MHNSFENLQKRCKNYRLKKVLIIIFPSLLLILTASFYLLYPNNIQTTQMVTPKEQVVVPKIEKKEIIEKKKIEVETIQKPKRKDLTYSMQINHAKVALKPKTNKQVPIQKKQKIVKKKSLKDTQKTVTQEVKNQMITMSVKSYDSLKQMKELYEKEKKYTLALKIGQKYYDKADYSNALKWSKEANILNHKEEGAWLLYAKSEYAKGNRTRAIKILKLYLGNAQSHEAQSILINWIKENK